MTERMTAEDFDRMATDAETRAELYEDFGMDRCVAAALNTADKARAAAAVYRKT